MKTPCLTLAAFALFAVGCTEPTPMSPEASARPLIGGPLFANQGNGVVHRVSVGGNDLDIAENGDANFSLVAIEYGDGSVSGQWTDQFGQGEGGFHAVINCLRVVGNEAWVSGVITSGSSGGFDFTGLPVRARVADRGTSANDPPDAISFSLIGNPEPCTAQRPFVLRDMTDGQVSVR